ncbi:ABC transporter ATP-binding protein [Roseibium aggregatum]|uniref:ABC transporter ATP-binding protein n=1 Tax=Roseibium aggregatum TaxID=187304 RepID=UPI0025AC409E|nr:ABC transporter ATP-binding protein [Roseibium aggregatum]WJS05470.1 ABC transporter ATP-binding protein [Roseibium aggregatum]
MKVTDLTIRTVGDKGFHEQKMLVNGIDFHVNPGEVLGIVGESGSGKSLSCLSLLGLTGRSLKSAGQLHFSGQTYSLEDPDALRALRGKKIGAVFQNPRASLNPVRTIGAHFFEVLDRHGEGGGNRKSQATALLEAVGIGEASRRLEQYPHQLSGGMCQRAMIALALAARPRLLIADEPTTALDTTIQAQVLDLIDEIRTKDGMSVIFVSHDLGVIADIADRVAVMRCGTIVETSACTTLFSSPATPYARSLVNSISQARRNGPDGRDLYE